MSSVTVINKTRKVLVESKGIQGAPGVRLRGDWVLDENYGIRDSVYNDGSTYYATVPHVSSADNEPGTGPDWQDFWKILALGAEIEDIDIVASIADQIETVAGLESEIRALGPVSAEIKITADNIDAVNGVYAIRTQVAGVNAISTEILGVYSIRTAIVGVDAISVEVQGVYAIRVPITTVHDNIAAIVAVYNNLPAVILAANNMAAIIAAPSAAADAAASAAAAASATLVRYEPGGPIYNAANVPVGGYEAEIRAFRASVQTRLAAVIRNSDPNGSITFYVDVNGFMVSGPHVVTATSPLDIATNFPVAVGNSVTFYVTASTGNVKEFYPVSYGAIA